MTRPWRSTVIPGRCNFDRIEPYTIPRSIKVSISFHSLISCIHTICSGREEKLLAARICCICSVLALSRVKRFSIGKHRPNKDDHECWLCLPYRTCLATNQRMPSEQGGHVRLPSYVQNSLKFSAAWIANSRFKDNGMFLSGSLPLNLRSSAVNWLMKVLFWLPGSAKIDAMARTFPAASLCTKCISARDLMPFKV